MGIQSFLQVKTRCRRRGALLLRDAGCPRQVLQVRWTNFCAATSSVLDVQFENAARLFYAIGINKAAVREAIFVTFDMLTRPFWFGRPCNWCLMWRLHALTGKCVDGNIFCRALGALRMQMLQVVKLAVMHKHQYLERPRAQSAVAQPVQPDPFLSTGNAFKLRTPACQAAACTWSHGARGRPRGSGVSAHCSRAKTQRHARVVTDHRAFGRSFHRAPASR